MPATAELAKNKCVPCRGGIPPLKGGDLKNLHEKLGDEWNLVEEHHLERAFKFDGWRPAVAFVNTVSDIANEQDHHPDIYLSWGKVNVKIWTHKIDGLTESDFFFAAKCEEAYRK